MTLLHDYPLLFPAICFAVAVLCYFVLSRKIKD